MTHQSSIGTYTHSRFSGSTHLHSAHLYASLHVSTLSREREREREREIEKLVASAEAELGMQCALCVNTCVRVWVCAVLCVLNSSFGSNSSEKCKLEHLKKGHQSEFSNVCCVLSQCFELCGGSAPYVVWFVLFVCVFECLDY